MKSHVDFLFQKCQEHIDSGGQIVRRLNGVTYAGEDTETLHHDTFDGMVWRLNGQDNCSCPLGTLVIGAPVTCAQLYKQAAGVLEEPTEYGHGFVYGFDGLEKLEGLPPAWSRGFRDGQELAGKLKHKKLFTETPLREYNK